MAHRGWLYLALALVATSIVIAWAITHRNARLDSVSVVGLGQRDFESNLIVWQGEFSRESKNLQEAYSLLQRDRQATEEFLRSKGVQPTELQFSAVSITRLYTTNYDEMGRIRDQHFAGFRLLQTVRIESGDLDRIEGISRDIAELISRGVEFNSGTPQYFYTKLDSLKIALIAAATADARRRAETIAHHAGTSLGDVQSASLGVFQITERNSSEELDWGGTFNTTARQKTARVTVRLRYRL
ncbi:MAG: SIMPL domain-containing protein [Candidatus Kapaibacterium sp.]|nr:MAG: SIMPL domain-containing protein [Candidatus Kapabacteria bacterium]